MIEVVNRQRTKKVNIETWAKFANKALDSIGNHGSTATIAFVSDRRIQDLNRRFRNVDKPTDVLSFPADEKANLGDIAISIDRAAAQAKENGLALDDEIAQLILHGLLHLCGYDHETDNGEMNQLELRLRKKLGI